jgi:hypothetical protein
MLMTVLARMIDIKLVVRMFDSGYSQSTGAEFADEVDNERGFPCVFETRNTENFHNHNVPQLSRFKNRNLIVHPC